MRQSATAAEGLMATLSVSLLLGNTAALGPMEIAGVRRRQ